MPRKYSPHDLKVLFASSLNRCAFPQCDNPIVVDSTDADPAAVIGHVAHIVASSARGPRGDPAFPKEDLDREPNLILLCGHHHALVDAQGSTYSIEDLRGWKEARARERAVLQDRPGHHPPAPPRRLPPAPLIVNREQELALLDGVLTQADKARGPVVAVVTGMHGVGKSAVASHWANGMRERFDGGDLYGDFSRRRVRGGVEVSDVLGDFIRHLGTSPVGIPPTLAERTGLFRNITASKRLLVLLDDVGDAAHVTPLLPTGAGSVVVVTSNSYLEELLAQRAKLIPLEPLDDATARDLLAEIAGRERIDSEPDASDKLISICGGLPITLCVAAAALARHRGRAVSRMVATMTDEATRLRGLSGRGELSIEDVFDFAYGDLEADEALLYRRLGIHPGPEFTAAHAATLADASIERAEEQLDVLTDRHLVEALHDERYRLHDLIRIHARACAERDDSAAERERSVRRLIDWYYAALCKADRTLISERLRLAPEPDIAVKSLPDFGTREDAVTWFDLERPNLIAVLRAALDIEWDDRIWQMAEAMWLFFYNRKPFSDWIEACEAGIASARRLGDQAAEGRMHQQLSRAHLDLRDYASADADLIAAETAAELSGHERLRASVREFRGAYHMNRGDYDPAVEEFKKARSVFARCGDRRGVAVQDYHIGAALTQKGEPRYALEPLERSVSVMRDLGDAINIARTLLHLGRAQKRHGCTAQAEASLREAIAVAVPLGIRHTEAEAYEELADIADGRHHAEHAAAHRRRAYTAYLEIGHPRADELLAAMGGHPQDA